jgi:DNA-binding CsgD family transcriptional regulator
MSQPQGHTGEVVALHPVPATGSAIAVVDSSGLFAEVLARALRGRGIDVVLPRQSGWSAVPEPAVVVLDARLLETRAEVGVRPSDRVLLLRPPGSDPAGPLPQQVVGQVSHGEPLGSVVSALRAIYRGAPCATSTTRDRGDAPPALTRRELEVLDLVAVGRSNEQIAAALGISVHTVRAHQQRIRLKLGADNRFAVVARARAVGLLSRSPSPEPD